MFIDEAAVLRGIRKAFEDYYSKAAEEVKTELTSHGYEDIISDVNITSDFENINIVFKDKLDKKQDTMEVLAQGGALNIGGENKPIQSSRTLRKYLGKR